MTLDPSTLPLCDCPCHSNGVIDAGECFCTPDCIRGEARSIDFTSRDELVAWLIENDPNGCHADDEQTEEMGTVHTLESAIACYRSVMDIADEDDAPAPEDDRPSEGYSAYFGPDQRRYEETGR